MGHYRTQETTRKFVSWVFLLLHCPRQGTAGAGNLEVPVGTDKNAPIKACFLEPKSQRRDSLARQKNLR